MIANSRKPVIRTGTSVRVACFGACVLAVAMEVHGCASSCPGVHVAAADSPAQVDSVVPQAEFVAHSRSSQRELWWPAVENLGKVAASDHKLRTRIWRDARVNTLGMKFTQIPAGAFTMGPDHHRVVNSQIAHEVSISRGYYIAVTETTNAQFSALFPEYQPDLKYAAEPDAPAVNITWDMAVEFCNRLSDRENATYRLPTEAEWEYACRAGSTARFCFGDDPSSLADYGWCGQTRESAAPVGMLKPNAWGLHDMHGNAVEWVADWFSREYYAECARAGVVVDPPGPVAGSAHVLRGGPWHAKNEWACSCTARFPRPILERPPFDWDSPGVSQLIGFRVVRDLDDLPLDE